MAKKTPAKKTFKPKRPRTQNWDKSTVDVADISHPEIIDGVVELLKQLSPKPKDIERALADLYSARVQMKPLQRQMNSAKAILEASGLNVFAGDTHSGVKTITDCRIVDLDKLAARLGKELLEAEFYKDGQRVEYVVVRNKQG
jgi:hypothetical protein